MPTHGTKWRSSQIPKQLTQHGAEAPNAIKNDQTTRDPPKVPETSSMNARRAMRPFTSKNAPSGIPYISSGQPKKMLRRNKNEEKDQHINPSSSMTVTHDHVKASNDPTLTQQDPTSKYETSLRYQSKYFNADSGSMSTPSLVASKEQEERRHSDCLRPGRHTKIAGTDSTAPEASRGLPPASVKNAQVDPP